MMSLGLQPLLCVDTGTCVKLTCIACKARPLQGAFLAETSAETPLEWSDTVLLVAKRSKWIALSNLLDGWCG